ncbi:MAG: FAD/NAD(P)-binding protein [Verrucomicrobia bacterium]|nr:FAD/NAD(P)-binding protein [Verrucomicrobiota bacterium]
MLNGSSPDRGFHCDVAVVGTGFSGTLTAVHLARLSAGKVAIALIEKRKRFARGVAYATEDPSHLLNVPLAKMGAYAEDPEHFLRWCRQHPDRCRAAGVEDFHAGSFVPRKLYGDYLEELLAAARRQWPSLRLVQGEVGDLRPKANGQFGVELADGRALNAAKVVLALGNFPPGDPKLRDQRFHTSSRYLTDPWAEATVERLSEPGAILILGSGLTALDLLLSLAKRRRGGGLIHLISRRGLFPQPHACYLPCPRLPNASTLPGSPRQALRQVRLATRQAAEAGSDWRAVIDGLRPFTQTIWQQWDRVERHRFLRHLRAYWEPHRHRASPEALAVKNDLETRGSLVCYRGRVQRITENATGLEAEFIEVRRPDSRRLQVNYVVNCTGPECNYHKLKDPLVMQLFLRGLITPDPLFLGIEVGPEGIVYNVYGERIPNLYTLGSPQKGRLLETTAVPELRVQAEALAKRLWCEFDREVERAGVKAGSANPIPAYEI